MHVNIFKGDIEENESVFFPNTVYLYRVYAVFAGVDRFAADCQSAA